MPSEEVGTGDAGGGGLGEHESVDLFDDRDDDIQDDLTNEDLVASLEEELELSRAKISDLERQLASETMQSELERQLVDAGAVDLETAIVLAELRLAEGGVTIAEAVGSLMQSKGFLFRRPGRTAGASALSGAPARPKESLEELAHEARETGDRRAVLRYLRRRRG